MEWIPVVSSNIKSVAWENDILAILFDGGRVFYFDKVPNDVYRELMASESKGRYFHSKIKGHFKEKPLKKYK